jgi:hypothetical protein
VASPEIKVANSRDFVYLKRYSPKKVNFLMIPRFYLISAIVWAIIAIIGFIMVILGSKSPWYFDVGQIVSLGGLIGSWLSVLNGATAGGQRELLAGQGELIAGQKELLAGQKELLAGQKELLAVQKELLAGQKELLAGQRELLAMQKELIEGQRETLETVRKQHEEIMAMLRQQSEEHKEMLEVLRKLRVS